MSDARGDLRRLARGGTANLLGLCYYGGASFLLVIIVTRALGARQAGAFLIAVAAFSILVRSTQLGADIGMVRTVSGHLAQGRAAEIPSVARVAFLPVALFATIAGVLVFIFARPLAEVLGGTEMENAVAGCLRIIAVVLPVAAVYQVLESTSRGYGTVVPSVAVEKIGRVTLQLLGVIAVITAGLGPVAVTAAWAFPWIVGLITLSWWIHKLHRNHMAGLEVGSSRIADASQSPARDFWRFAAPRAPAGTFQACIMWGDALILAALTTTAQAGIYSAATRYMVIGVFAQLAISQTIQPILGGLVRKGDLDAAEQTYRTGSGWLIALTWPIFLTVGIFALPLLSVFGPAFVAADTALMILCVGWLVATACGPVDNVLLMAGKGGWTSINSGIGLALNVGLNLWLIPRFGITGAALAWSACLIWMNVCPLIQVHASLGVNPFGPAWPVAVTGAALIFGGILVCVRFLVGASFTGLAIALVMAVPAYAVYLRAARQPLQLGTLVGALRTPGPQSDDEN